VLAAWSEAAKGIQGGSLSFAHGHVLNWGRIAVSDAHPLFERAEALAQEHGTAKRDWMFNMRNLTIFPNLQIAENASSQLRVIQPIAAGRTLMRTWCIAPRGESPAARRQRFRQYEDFFNPSGMATPDDTVAYESCQRGFASAVEPWLQGYALANDRDHKASMLQDRLAGRTTEIDAINGAIVQRGTALGVATPVNATLADMVRLISRVEQGRS